MHTSVLVERHEISVPVPVAQPDIATYSDAVAAMFDQAHTWHAAHGLEPTGLARFARTASADGQAAVGVQWTVTVGRGDISEDQRLPGVMDSWKWSARFHHWRKVFNRMDGRQGRLLALREDGRASVTRLFPDERSSAVIAPDPLARPLNSADQRPPWMHRSTEVGARTGPVDGCTCHLPGPFKDICPVHFDADT